MTTILDESTPAQSLLRQSSRLTVAMLGCGVVGGGVAARLLSEPHLLGVSVQLARVLVRDLHKPRFPEAAIPHLTTDPSEIVDDPNVDVVVEAIGGVEPARTYVEAALLAGKHVVTSNKTLIAECGGQLSALATQRRVSLRYEASVAGAIPVVRALQESLSAEPILEISGVLNGTSNFVLRTMRDGGSVAGAIQSAQAAGYAEVDPSDDVDGMDAARKLSVLAPLAFGRRIAPDTIVRTSLRTLDEDDLAFARRMGCAFVPLSLLRRSAAGGFEAAVVPVMVPQGHDFARLRGPENTVRVVGEHSGTLAFSGHGAGREATASAVLSDLAEIARRRARWQAQWAAPVDFPEKTPEAPMFEHYLRADEAALARALEDGRVRTRPVGDGVVLTEPVALGTFRDSALRALPVFEYEEVPARS